MTTKSIDGKNCLAGSPAAIVLRYPLNKATNKKFPVPTRPFYATSIGACPMPDIVLIHPRFENSYWSMEHALGLLGGKAVLPVASLPLLSRAHAARVPVTLIDENVEPIDFDRCARADIVGLTGMFVQRSACGRSSSS